MAAFLKKLLADFTGGANLRDQPLGLAENECLALVNMYPLAGGALIGRGGQTAFNAIQIDANPIKSLYRFYKQDGSARLLATSGTTVYLGNTAGGTWSSLSAGYSAGQRFSFTSWSAKDKVYWINGSQALVSYDGSAVPPFVGGSPPVGAAVEFHRDRLWILLDNQVAFSDLNVDDTWQSAARLNIADKKGGRGKFLKSANGLLLAGKDTGQFRFTGSPILGGELEQYSNIGCVAAASAAVVTSVAGDGQTIPAAVMFLGVDGVYYTNGYTVQRVSPKIDPLFTAQFTGAVGYYYAKRQQYWLSFNPAGGPNNTVWVGTKLDLPGGQTIAWSQYTGFNLDSFVAFDGPGDTGELYGGLSTGGLVRRLDTGGQDMGVDYECKVTTRNIDFDHPDLTKSVRWLKTTFSAGKPVSYALNYFDREFASSSIEQQNITGLIWDVGQWDVNTWAVKQFADTRTSTLFSGLGRYVSLTLANKGDGPNFRIDRVQLEARAKEGGAFELFTLNAMP
jgi:hypothetical protein